MKTAVACVAMVGAASAYTPTAFMGTNVAQTVSTSSSTTMQFWGSPKKAAPKPAFGKAVPAPTNSNPAVTSLGLGETPVEVAKVGGDASLPYWDPWGLADGKSAETIAWYREAELKHGRIAMLACLGTWITAAGIFLPDPVFQGNVKSFAAFHQVLTERPQALIQIAALIGYLETGLKSKNAPTMPGDLSFDPLGLSKKELDLNRVKELKNGRLAMLGIMGMWMQEAGTGQSVFEQIQAKHFSPFGDGQGFF